MCYAEYVDTDYAAVDPISVRRLTEDKDLRVLLKAFSRSVRELREKQGISQEELADRSGLHRTYISNLERAEVNVSLKNIKKLAHGLGISMTSLVDHVERKSAKRI